MTNLKRHRNGKVSCAGEIKLGRFETCLLKEVGRNCKSAEYLEENVENNEVKKYQLRLLWRKE